MQECNIRSHVVPVFDKKHTILLEIPALTHGIS